jgi:hypothetical protein
MTSTEPSMKSPLMEADPELSIAEIFARDPEELTRANRSTIVAELRKARANFAKKEAEEKVKKPRAKKPEVTLEELFGGELK